MTKSEYEKLFEEVYNEAHREERAFRQRSRSLKEVQANPASILIAKDENGNAVSKIDPNTANPQQIASFLRPGKNRMILSESGNNMNRIFRFLRERVIVPAGMIVVTNENGEKVKEFPATDDGLIGSSLEFVKRGKGRAMIAG